MHDLMNFLFVGVSDVPQCSEHALGNILELFKENFFQISKNH